MDPRASLDAVEERKKYCPCREFNPDSRTKLAQVVTLLIYIREVPGLNPGKDTDHPEV
jgi:hypothetical protein